MFDGWAQKEAMVIPIHGIIDYIQECIVRRGLKNAQQRAYQHVILDINTPGGSVENMLHIIEDIQKSKLCVWAYVNKEAISAGSFIANCCDKVFFHPQGIMGAAAVIAENGENLETTLQLKIDSYLWAKVRSFCEKFPDRYEWQRAMMDKDFVLKVGKQVLKKKGELLSLTATEAENSFPQLSALSSGTYETIDLLIQTTKICDTYHTFRPSGFESLAKFFSALLPLISGLGFLFLLIEFKTPGFGLMGCLGIFCLGFSFLCQFLAGLGGLEGFVLLGIGIVCVFIDLLFLGTIFVTLLGICLAFLGVGIGGMNIWPHMTWVMSDFYPLLKTLAYTLLWTFVLWGIAWKLGLFKAGLNRITLKKHLNALKHKTDAATQPIGLVGQTLTPLMPSGQACFEGKTLPVCVINGTLPRGKSVVIIGKKDFEWIVEEHS